MLAHCLPLKPGTPYQISEVRVVEGSLAVAASFGQTTPCSCMLPRTYQASQALPLQRIGPGIRRYRVYYRQRPAHSPGLSAPPSMPYSIIRFGSYSNESTIASATPVPHMVRVISDERKNPLRREVLPLTPVSAITSRARCRTLVCVFSFIYSLLHAA